MFREYLRNDTRKDRKGKTIIEAEFRRMEAIFVRRKFGRY